MEKETKKPLLIGNARKRLFLLLSFVSATLLLALALTIPSALSFEEFKQVPLADIYEQNSAEEVAFVDNEDSINPADLQDQLDTQKQTIAEIYDELLVKQQELNTKEQQLNLLRDQVIMGEENSKQIDSLKDQLDAESGKTLVLETQLATYEAELKQWRNSSVDWDHDKELADEFGRLYQEARLEVVSLQSEIQEIGTELSSLKSKQVSDQKKLDKISSAQEKYIHEKQIRIKLEGKVKELKALLDQQRESFAKLEVSRKQLVDQLKASEQLSYKLLRQARGQERVTAMIESSKPPQHFSRTHVVSPGDTLTLISLKHYGTAKRWKEIFEANRHQLTSEDQIHEGMELAIP